MKQLPLQGILVLEFCQYLSGPSAGLRLADLGARVIKIENPKYGDLCRILAIKDQWIEENSLLFHTINRNKESYTANLKSEIELSEVKNLIRKADVLIHNFRPGIMEKLGLGYDALKVLNTQLIYAEISGYGADGPWAKKPGQDLLIQALSGLMYTSGNHNDPPTPFGIAIADILCGAQLVQAIIASLYLRFSTGEGSKIEISLLESLIDFQFEFFTTYFESLQKPIRSKDNNGNPLLGAPYGIYKTKDGFLALAMIPIEDLNRVLKITALEAFNQSMVFSHRDTIKAIIADKIITRSTSFWTEQLGAEGLWATDVKSWKTLYHEDGFKQAKIIQEIMLSNGSSFKTTRCPIRINGELLINRKSAPSLGAHTALIKEEFNLNVK